jgi:hypothetical protein
MWSRCNMSRTPRPSTAEQIRQPGATTIVYYDRFARVFWDGTQHHDVSQNYLAFLIAIEGGPPASLFHDPSQELPRVLRELFRTLKPRGVLFSSNP